MPTVTMPDAPQRALPATRCERIRGRYANRCPRDATHQVVVTATKTRWIWDRDLGVKVPHVRASTSTWWACRACAQQARRAGATIGARPRVGA